MKNNIKKKRGNLEGAGLHNNRDILFKYPLIRLKEKNKYENECLIFHSNTNNIDLF